MSGSEATFVRVARADDFAAVLALWQRARSSAATTPDSDQAVDRLLATDPSALLVAELSGELVGVVIAAWDGWRGTVYRLAVAPEQRRRGIGSALAAAAWERLRLLGAPKVTLMVGNEDEHAAGFWTAVGYHHDDEVRRLVRLA